MFFSRVHFFAEFENPLRYVPSNPVEVNIRINVEVAIV